MKIVSLFDGISCGRVAFEYAGIPVTSYHAYEIEPNAIVCSRYNWPDIVQMGSVVGADFRIHRGADFVIGGFPCTDLSIAKDGRQGLAGKNSRLFWEQVRAIREINPRYFLVENNYGMPKEAQALITSALGVEPIYINSALVSAQNRKRLYWTNIPGVEAPEDELITLADVLEERVPLKYYHSKHAINYQMSKPVRLRAIQHPGREKGYTVTAAFNKGAPQNAMAVPVIDRVGHIGNLNTAGKVMQGYGIYNPEGKHLAITASSPNPYIATPVELGNVYPTGSQAGRFYDPTAKSVCLTANGGGMGAKTGMYAFPCAIRTWPRVSRDNRHKRPEIREDVKANALLTGSTENMIVQSAYDDVPVFDVRGGIMTYGENTVKVKLPDGYYALRRLTPLECERLQTLPDHYTDMIADTHRYKTLGNGWTAKVIAHIISYSKHADLL